MEQTHNNSLKRKGPDSNPNTNPKRPRTSHEVEDDVLILWRPENGIPRKYKSFEDTEGKLTEDLLNVVEQFKSERIDKETTAAAILKVLYNFFTGPAAGRALEERLNSSFSQVRFADVAPFFHPLVPHAYNERHAGFATFTIKPFRLPEPILEDILADLERKFNEFGFPDEHGSESAPNQCFSAIFTRLLENFPGIFINEPEVTTPLDVSKERGQIKHRWMAFEAVCITFCERGLDEYFGSRKLTSIARMILESDGCAQLNHMSGHCVPIIGIGSSGAQIQGLVYHPHTRKFFLSKIVEGFPSESGTLKLLKAIRRMSETFMTLFLCSYINSLDAYLQRSEFWNKQEGKCPESTIMWGVALRLAKDALKIGQDASKVIKDQGVEERIRIIEAEEGARAAMELLKESFSKAPENGKAERPSLLAEFRDSENRERLAKDEMWGLS